MQELNESALSDHPIRIASQRPQKEFIGGEPRDVGFDGDIENPYEGKEILIGSGHGVESRSVHPCHGFPAPKV